MELLADQTHIADLKTEGEERLDNLSTILSHHFIKVSPQPLTATISCAPIPNVSTSFTHHEPSHQNRHQPNFHLLNHQSGIGPAQHGAHK